MSGTSRIIRVRVVWLSSLWFKLARVSTAVLLFLNATAAPAHAHGGMAGPDELGPPLFTSAALGFVCYWVVVLWPKSKPKNPDSSRSLGRDHSPRGRSRWGEESSGVSQHSGLKRAANAPRKTTLNTARKDRCAGG
jgi:hypothetical protein